MTILRPGVALLLALITGCVRKPYQPAGGSGPQNVGGFYDMVETLNSTTCGPVAVRKQRIRVEVQHQPGASIIKLVEEVRPWDARLLPNGTFNVITPLKTQDAKATYTMGFAGRFTDSSFTARVDVAVTDLVPRARGDARPSACAYQLQWTATKL